MYQVSAQICVLSVFFIIFIPIYQNGLDTLIRARVSLVKINGQQKHYRVVVHRY